MIRRLRLFSGLVMLAYVTMHLLNHAVGLISPEAMENVLWYIFRIWTNRPAQLVIYSSFLVHYALALYALWQRQTLRLRASELSQVVLGFAIPFLLVRHVVTTRISDSFLHTDVGYYAYLLWVYFVRSPEHGVVQMLVLVVAWGHAMIGLHFWLKVRPWFARLQPTALVVAVLVPVLSLLAATEAGRQVTALAADPNWIKERITLPSPEAQSTLETITELLSWFFAAMVGAVLLARVVRRIWQRRHGLVRIGYPDGRIVEVTPGTSVLEASRLAGIPHASVCGGRGRCSTCRIRVRGEMHSMAPPPEDEQLVLRRIRATSNVRLACQLRPRGAVEVTPLLPPFARAVDGGAESTWRRAASARLRSCSSTFAASPRSPKAGFPMTWCSFSTAISQRWDERSKRREDASTSSSATASWRCSGSSATPIPAAERRSPPPGSFPRGSTN